MGAPLGEPDRIGAILAHAWSILTAFDGPCYSVIGNHDVYDLTKGEFLTIIDATDTYFSFDVGAYHLVVLDAQNKRTGEDYGRVGWMVQGTIPKPQLAWLEEDLANTSKPTLVCIHQPLDVDFSLTAGGPPVFNHKEVQSIIAQSGVVIAVFQGHDHENNYTLINGIHYLTFEALVNEEERAPSWAYVTLDPVARTITITGEGEQADWELQY
jgi:alkaline phosphatase